MMLLEYPGTPQVGQRTYFPRDLPYGGAIDKRWDDVKIDCFIRAYKFTSKPYAHVFINDCKHLVGSLDVYKKISKDISVNFLRQ